jgi:hypothetical protein
MIEPTVGRIDLQEEVATLHDANIPLAAYLHEIGSPVLRIREDPPPIIWRDFFSHCMSVAARGNRSIAAKPGTRVYDAYWSRSDPIPSLFHFVDGSVKSLQKTLRLLRKRRFS